jgi:hypothetical protein
MCTSSLSISQFKSFLFLLNFPISVNDANESAFETRIRILQLATRWHQTNQPTNQPTQPKTFISISLLGAGRNEGRQTDRKKDRQKESASHPNFS